MTLFWDDVVDEEPQGWELEAEEPRPDVHGAMVRTTHLRKGARPVAVIAPCQGRRTYLYFD